MNNTLLLEALGKTLIDSIGQGIIVLLVVMFLLWLAKNQSAKLRHNVLFIGIILMPILSANSFISHYSNGSQVINTVTLEQLSASDDLTVSTLDTWDSSTITDFALASYSWPTQLEWLSYAWLLGFLICLVRMSGGFLYLYRLNAKAEILPLASINDRLNAIKSSFGIKRRVFVKTSEKIASPLIYGVFKPVIIFPLGLIQGLTSEEVEAILLHELSHLKRNDFIINIVINVLKTIYFYHPAFWWMSAQLDNEREFASDEMVLSHQTNAVDLIKALSKTQEYQMSGPAMAFAGSSKNQLLKRVNRIMKKQQKPNWLGGLLATIILASAFLLTSQQSKEKLDQNKGPLDSKIDSIPAHMLKADLEISEQDAFGAIEGKIDSISISEFQWLGKVSLNSDTIPLEKALAEILSKKSDIMVEMTMDKKVTNISKGGKELSGDAYEVYKQAYEMIHNYADNYSKNWQKTDAEEESVLKYQLMLTELELKQKVMLETMKLKEKDLEERELERQEYKEKIEEYENKLNVYRETRLSLQERAEAIREKREVILKQKNEEEKSDLQQEKIEKELAELGLDYVRISSKNGLKDPAIWVVTKSQKDTLVLNTLTNINPEDINSLDVYKDKVAEKLLPKKAKNYGIVLVDVTKEEYQRLKKEAKKLKRSQRSSVMQKGPSFEKMSLIRFDLKQKEAVKTFWSMMDDLDYEPKIKYVVDDEVKASWVLEDLKKTKLSNYVTLSVIKPGKAATEVPYDLEGFDALIRITK